MRYLILLALFTIVGCQTQNQSTTATKNGVTTVVSEDYEFIKANNSKALLVVFPGGGTTSKETKADFKVIEKATEKQVSVLLMNFNRHFWIEKEDAEQLTQILSEVINKHDLQSNKVYVGGMSIGGTVALSLANHLAATNTALQLSGTFVVDSPIDLYALYESAQKDIAREDFSEERLAEPKFIVNYLEEAFGGKAALLQNIQKVSPFTLATNNTNNIAALKSKKLRFYTEPDTLWWKNVRQTDFESTNAFVLQKASELLLKEAWTNAELIQTKDKGYRNNGERHPHSWSIVDIDELLGWILKK